MKARNQPSRSPAYISSADSKLPLRQAELARFERSGGGELIQELALLGLARERLNQHHQASMRVLDELLSLPHPSQPNGLQEIHSALARVSASMSRFRVLSKHLSGEVEVSVNPQAIAEKLALVREARRVSGEARLNLARLDNQLSAYRLICELQQPARAN